MTNQATLAGDAAPLRVLLVDDHVDTAELLRMLLVRRGYVVTIARSVATALHAASLTPFDVLVSDIGLTDGSGCDLLRQLREARHIPAIALSGRDREVDVQTARDAGFDEYLGKPVGIAQLVEALQRVAGR